MAKLKFTDLDRDLLHVLSDLLVESKMIAAVFAMNKTQKQRGKLFQYVKENLNTVTQPDILAMSTALSLKREQYYGQNLWIRYTGESNDELTKDSFYEVGMSFNADEIYLIINNKDEQKEYAATDFVKQTATRIRVKYLEAPLEWEILDGLEMEAEYDVVGIEKGTYVLENGKKCAIFRTESVEFKDAPMPEIKKQPIDELLRFYGILIMYNRASHIKRYIAEDCKYDSEWGGFHLEGRQAIIDHCREIHANCMKESVFYVAEQGKIIIEEADNATIGEGTPCLVLTHKGKYQALIVLTVDDNGMITHIRLLDSDDYTFEAARKKSNVVHMQIGHNTSSYFWIHPCNVTEGKTQNYWELIDLKDDELSIEEDDVWCYLAYFYLKYFDDMLPANQNRVEYYAEGKKMKVADGFEWWLEHNIYTYEQMDKLLDDISNLTKLMREDNQDEIKRLYPTTTYEHYNEINLYENIYENYLYNPAAAHILYVRYIAIIKEMMINNPDCKYFSIMGP